MKLSKKLLGSLELNRIYQMDCLEGMKLIPDASIDMILCDLPYGTTSCKWDSVLPLEKLWEQYERVIKTNGAVVLTASQPFTSALVMSNLKLFRYEWIWEKNYSTGYGNANRMPMKNHESVLVFYKKLPIYNPQGLIPYGKEVKRGSVGEYMGKSGLTVEAKNIQEFTNYPRTVQMFKKEGKTVHPTQKPVSLFEYMILTYTNESDIILDNCMGSGTTAVAALKSNRMFIGFETDSQYIEVANIRIESTYNELVDKKSLEAYGLE